MRSRSTATYVLIAMTLANAMILVDQTAVPLALPDIMKTFDTGSKQVQWVLNCSLLPLAGLLVFAGRLGDLVGLRKVFLTGSVLFIGGSVIAGAAPSLEVLLAARVVQGTGGALMLPLTIAIVSAAFPASESGKALGTMGGTAAVFAALGPTIGGVLTETFSWRAVLLVNVPLAAATIWMTLRFVEDHRPTKDDSAHIDLEGTVLLSITLVGLVFGLSQSAIWGWGSPGVIGPLTASVLAGVLFVFHERRAASPLVDFGLLRERNYLGASVSQFLSGMAEIGLGVIFPLLLILNLEMNPALAGLALIPTTLPMIVVAPYAGRWYDRVGGRPPLVTGFLLLAVAGGLLALGVADDRFLSLLPGLLVYGIGLSLVLSVNDPVSLDQIAPPDHGQASGVSATAEQFGGAVGIAVLYSIFHGAYLNDLEARIDRSSLPDLTATTGAALRNAFDAAEATGLRPGTFNPKVREYIAAAEQASNHGYVIVFAVVAALSLIAAGIVAWLVRKPAGQPAPS